MVKDFKVPIKVTLNGDIAQMSIDDEENAEYGNEEY